MISKYEIFCKIIEMDSFTKAAEKSGYSQSAVSQAIKSLEQEIGSTLIDRRKDGIRLTSDGEQYYPYIRSIFSSEKALLQKQREMNGLKNSTIQIGTFTSVSRNLLLPLMKSFKCSYPEVNYILKQGDYSSIEKWIQEGIIDFGFVNSDVIHDIELHELYKDEMLAILPLNHPLAKKNIVSLADLSTQPFILLDEGEYSVPIASFKKNHLTPYIEYEVYDDYTILEMVRQGLGISTMYRKVLNGFEQGMEVRPIKEHPERTIAIAWRSWDTMSFASRKFAAYIIKNT